MFGYIYVLWEMHCIIIWKCHPVSYFGNMYPVVSYFVKCHHKMEMQKNCIIFCHFPNIYLWSVLSYTIHFKNLDRDFLRLLILGSHFLCQSPTNTPPPRHTSPCHLCTWRLFRMWVDTGSWCSKDSQVKYTCTENSISVLCCSDTAMENTTKFTWIFLQKNIQFILLKHTQ